MAEYATPLRSMPTLPIRCAATMRRSPMASLADLMALTMQTMEPAGLAAIPSTLPILLITGKRAQRIRSRHEPPGARGPGSGGQGLDVTALYYPDARHELLNEVNRDEVYNDVRAWIERRVIPNG